MLSRFPGPLYIARTPEGSPGPYKVTFILAIPGRSSFLDELDILTLMKSGESTILATADFQVALTNETGSWTVHFTRNAKNQVSAAWIRVNAPNFHEAERWAYNQIAPVLSQWSYQYDAGIDIAGYEILEEQTQSQKWVFGVVGRRKVLEFNKGNLSRVEYRRLLSAYREAMNATNVFYQVLVFSKIIEGIKPIRAARRKDAMSRNETIREPSERFPSTLDEILVPAPLKEFFQPYIGKKFNQVFDELQNRIRNAIAHLDMTETKEVLYADNFDDIKESEKTARVLHYIAREMLKSETELAESE